jgi:multiple sugar transport system ATP-binding protein
MARIVIENALKKFGNFVAVDHVSLTIEDQEFVVLLGPSGCGKTTLLRAIAGLGVVDSGRITLDGVDITYLPPRDRNLSMVFQSYAIFPHMTVFDNVAFGLKMRRAANPLIQERVKSVAHLLHIDNMLDRYPSQMSGGQRQRVAVARALAVEAKVLLMDEPLSNLDALLRLEMRAELKTLLHKVGATTIYVTHDQIEALSMGDRIAVMKEGRILQYDHPNTVYDRPSHHFVGGFIGNPPMNFLSAQVQKQGADMVARVGDFTIQPDATMRDALRAYDGQSVWLGIRAENMETLRQPAGDALEVLVDVVEPLGSQNLLTITVNDEKLKVSTHPDFVVAPDEPIWLRFPASKIRWMDRDREMVIMPALEPATV